MKRRILLMDNYIKTLDVYARFLQYHDYMVFKAATLAEAEEILEKEYIQLAIFDVRMEDDDEERDTSGLRLAKQPHYQNIPKIILTAYPNFQHATDILRQLSGFEPPPAINYVDKARGPEHLLEAIEEAYETHININENLDIQEGTTSLIQLVNIIYPTIERRLIPQFADELEDLLRRLFAQATQITLSKTLLQRNGLVIFQIYVYQTGATPRRILLACGTPETMAVHHDKYATLAPQDAIAHVTLVEENHAVKTMRFDTQIYKLIGNEDEDTQPLRDFYQIQPLPEIRKTLEHFYTITLANWHMLENTTEESENVNFFWQEWRCLKEKIYSLRADAWLQSLITETVRNNLCLIISHYQSVEVRSLQNESIVLPNPCQQVEVVLEKISIQSSALYGVMHGNVTLDTIMVNDQGETWLLDFAWADGGPLLADYISLEMSIRLQMLEGIGLQERYGLEFSLVELDFAAKPSSNQLYSPQEKGLGVIQQIRNLAAEQDYFDEDQYYVGLFYYTLEHLTHYDPTRHYSSGEMIPFVHSFLLAGLLCQQLTGPPEISEPFKIDVENRQLWIDGHPIELTPQEWTIVAYLHAHVGQLRSAIQILEEGLGMEDVDFNVERSLFYTAMSRLTKKIESDGENRRFLHSVRGQGYRLQV